MSTASKIAFAGLSAARSRLQRLANGLRDAAGGAVVERAAAKVQDQIDAVAKSVLGRHVLSGAAQGSVDATHAGGLVQLSTIGYAKFHGWWPFRRGMPPFILKRAALVFARELLIALGADADNTEAADIVSEADAAAIAKVEKRAKRALVRRARR